MCLDPVVVSLSVNLLFGPLACRPGQKRHGGEQQVGTVLVGRSCLAQPPQHRQCQDWVCVSKWQLLPAAVQLMVCAAFIAAGWRAGERSFAFSAERVLKTFRREWEVLIWAVQRKEIKEKTSKPLLSKAPFLLTFKIDACHEHLLVWGRMGGDGNAASITECVELGKLLRHTSGEVEGGLCRVCLSGMLPLQAAAASCLEPLSILTSNATEGFVLSPLSTLPWEGAVRAKWNLACTERERWPLKGKATWQTHFV